MELLFSVFFAINIAQCIFTMYSMLYSWNNENNKDNNNTTPSQLKVLNKTSFTILLPALNESKVIKNTLKSIQNLDYPHELYNTILILREEDPDTLYAAKEALHEYSIENLSIVVVNSNVRNKPNQLNAGLKKSTGDYIVVFDAEDDINKDILKTANEKITHHKADVVQFGVQLMNFDSKWFSIFNVMEYYFWFKSFLPFYATMKVFPLAGNSAFIRRSIVESVGGWDETALTEDCELGIRIFQKDLKISVIYDPILTTKEEAPATLKSFIKQRTRWNQGFLQILFKAQWLNFTTPRKLLISFYFLIWPFMHFILLTTLVVSLFVVPFFEVSIWLSLFSIYSLLLLILQIVILNYGFYQFCKEYRIKYNIFYIFKIFILFIPYQLVVAYSTSRGIIRELAKNNSWEKTEHFNIHRKPS